MNRSSWFTSTLKEDIPTLTSQLSKCKNTHDIRKSSVTDKVIKGFCAIHYATLYNASLSLQFLLPHELHQLTQHETSFKSQHDIKKEMILAKDSDCLHVALTKARWNVAFDILDYIRNTDQDLSSNIDGNGYTHLALLMQFPSCEDSI